MPHLVAVCRNERRSLGSDPFDRDLGRRVRPSGFDDPLDELDRVEWLGTQVDSSRIELIREQYLVDDPPEPFGFLGGARSSGGLGVSVLDITFFAHGNLGLDASFDRGE